MALIDLTPEKLTQVIGSPVPELYVVIAKNSVLEMDTDSLCGLLGISRSELEEVESDEIYKSVRLLVASAHAEGLAHRDMSWDSIEEAALNKLGNAIQRNSDPDFLLRAAAVANKAQRRIRDQKERTLDPNSKEVRIPLRLTERIVQRIHSGGTETERVREISVVDGSGVNPSFAEIDQMLGLTAQPIPKPVTRAEGSNQAPNPNTPDEVDPMVAAFLGVVGSN